MSGNPASDIIPGSSEDPKAVEFVNMLRDKTSQGKIKWTEWDHGWLASLPNNVLGVFFSTKKLPYDWTKFNVQIGADIIFQVRKTLPDSLLTMSGVSDPAQRAANQLFAFIVGLKGNPLDKAIESLKQL